MSDPSDEQNLSSEAAQADVTGASVVSELVDTQNSQPSRSSSWTAFALLFNTRWLKNTAKMCIAFAPQCILPAGLFTVAGLSTTFGFHNCIAQMTNQPIELQNLFVALGVMFATSFVALVCLVWGFTVWLVRLNTFGHAFCLVDAVRGTILSHPSAPDVKADSLTSDTMSALFKASHAFVLSRKRYLARFYLLVSMVALVPAFLWMILCTVKLFTIQSPSPLIMKMSLPPLVDIGVMVILALLTAYLVGLSWISVVFSSISKAGANQAAWDCIKASLSKFLPMVLLALLTGVIGIVVSTPHVIINPSSALSNDMMSENLLTSIASEIWQGISSLVLLTFSLSPFCELMRDKMD